VQTLHAAAPIFAKSGLCGSVPVKDDLHGLCRTWYKLEEDFFIIKDFIVIMRNNFLLSVKK